jgi:hypothetical protein
MSPSKQEVYSHSYRCTVLPSHTVITCDPMQRDENTSTLGLSARLVVLRYFHEVGIFRPIRDQASVA